MQPRFLQQRGFTLYELLISVAIFIILTSVGIPSYISFVRNGQLSNISTTLFSDLMFARSEAMKRKTNVVVCRSANPTATSPACGGGTSGDWSTGWIVFADNGGTSGVYDTGDVLLRVSNPSMNTVKVTSNSNAATRITYGSDGSLVIASVPSILAMCDDRDGNGSYDTVYGRQINIIAIGRPQITVGNITSCTNPS
jgi:type IV fimbrial biogenesis protein FimT